MSFDELDRYDPAFVPTPYGHTNTGVICHFNSLLQGLASCSSVAKAALENRDYLSRTRTGRAFYDYMRTALPNAEPNEKRFGLAYSIEDSSVVLLRALVSDLRYWRPQTFYGPSQESASEGLVLLLDMMDDPNPKVVRTEIDESTGKTTHVMEDNPIARLFYHRQVASIYCKGCRKRVSDEESDISIQFNLLHYDTIASKPQSPEDFGEMLRSHISNLEGYRCEKCNRNEGGLRHYKLRLVPEVLVCVFDLYNDSAVRRPRYFPQEFSLPGLEGKKIHFKQVAQVEHSGSRSGGHYIARGIRKQTTYLFNDTMVSPTQLGPTPNVYMVFYNHRATE